MFAQEFRSQWAWAKSNRQAERGEISHPEKKHPKFGVCLKPPPRRQNGELYSIGSEHQKLWASLKPFPRKWHVELLPIGSEFQRLSASWKPPHRKWHERERFELGLQTHGV